MSSRQRGSGAKKPQQQRLVISSAVLSAIAALTARQASADSLQVFTQWNFDTVPSGVNHSPAPTIGTGIATPLGMTNSYLLADGHTFSVEASDITSTPLDPTQASGPGLTNAWRIRGSGGGGGNGWSTAAPQYTQGAEFDTSTAGKSGIVFTADWFSTNQGVSTLQEQYTADGLNWINVNPIQAAIPNGYRYALKIDFAALGITDVNDDANFGVRLVSVYDPNPPFNGTTYSGASGGIYNNSSGNWRFANVSFSFLGTATGGSGGSILTWTPPSTTWNSANFNWKDTNGATVSFGGTSTTASFTDAAITSPGGTATVAVAAGGISAAGINVSNTNGTYLFTGGPIDGGPFTKTGAGNVVFQGTANTFSALNLLGGTLHTSDDANLGAATARVTFNGGTLVADAPLLLSRFTSIGTNGGTLNSNAFSVTNAGTFSVGGAFRKIGAGDITFTGQVATSPGATFSVATGNVIFAGTSSAAVIIAPTGSNTFGGNIIVASSKGVSIQGGTVDGPGDIEIQANNSGFTGDSSSGTTSVTINVPIHANSLNLDGPFKTTIGMSGLGDIMVVTPNAVVSGNSTVVWSGKAAGGGGKATLIIQSVNTYTGDTIINNEAPGITRLGVDNPFPIASNLTFGDGSNTLNIGALDLAGHNLQVGSLATNLPSGTNFIAQFANGITNTSANQSTVTVSGTATTTLFAIIGVPTGVAVPGANNNIALTLGPSNTGSLTLQGLNTYTGPTTISAGTLQFDPAVLTIGFNTQSSMPAGAAIVNHGSLVVNSPASVASTIGGTGTTTVNGPSLSYINTPINPALMVDSMTQGKLINNGTTTINTFGSIGSVTGSGSLVIGQGPPASVTVGSFSQTSVLISNGSTLTVATNAARFTNVAVNLQLNGGATLDLGNHELLTSTAPDTIKGYLAHAMDAANNADWSKNGLTSSLAKANPATYSVAYAYGGDTSAQDAGITTRGGTPLAANQTIARVVLAGDANLDGSVDFFDITQVLGYKYNTGQAASYTDGDLNYDGKVDFFDLTVILSGNYNTGQNYLGGPAAAQAESAFAAASAASVPEPSVLGGLGLLACASLRRSRRRQR